MKNEISLMQGHVYHSRSETAENSFKYPIMNIYFPLSEQLRLRQIFKKNFYGLLSLDSRNYISNSKSLLQPEIKAFVKTQFNYDCAEVFLQTIPKMFGFVFNPISFWYFFRKDLLEAVLCEVSNTFGEKHYYWLYQNGQDLKNTWLVAKKEFHVSPFFDLEGHYKFKFIFNDNKLEAHIQLMNPDQSLRLVTWIKGALTPLDEASAFMVILNYGWMTPLVLLRIHYQAVKLFFKKVKFFRKPQPPEKDVTHGTSLIRR